jgi:hypothetical protein
MNSASAAKAAHLILIVRPPSRLEITDRDAQTYLGIARIGIDGSGKEKVRERGPVRRLVAGAPGSR